MIRVFLVLFTIGAYVAIASMLLMDYRNLVISVPTSIWDNQ